MEQSLADRDDGEEFTDNKVVGVHSTNSQEILLHYDIAYNPATGRQCTGDCGLEL